MARIGETASGWSSHGGGDFDGPAVLVIADAARRGDAEASVVAAGGRLLGPTAAWRDAATRLTQQGSARVVLAEAHGAADDAIVPALGMLDALARSGDSRLVVALAFEQIDLFAANLTAPGVELLCAPSPGERFTALRLAGLSAGTELHEVGRESEAARLQRLHEEVARIAETLTRLTRSDPAPRADDYRARGLAEPGIGYRGPPGVAGLDIGAREIRETIRSRRLRDQYFGQGLFEDPAWDMLLDLFAAELERSQVSVSSLCIAAAVAPTTALRWIARMTEAGLFERQPDPFDRRRAFMGLSPRASAGMRDYIAAIRRGGGTIA